jgi:hypothetical protein
MTREEKITEAVNIAFGVISTCHDARCSLTPTQEKIIVGSFALAYVQDVTAEELNAEVGLAERGLSEALSKPVHLKLKNRKLKVVK